ncbi:tautomerase family protein [Mycolicibacterium sp.]|uniref:tautomerase family protein n=1 Tax=Mycolicibacterium sp. TaxID=2320850 RepID=UPI003D0C88FB
MPMCDAYIPAGFLDEDTERTLVARVTDILVGHEIRRIVDLMDDPQTTERIRKRARAIAWAFVHRTDTYVAGVPAQAPVYKFVCSIPEGQIDEFFIPAANRDIMAAVVDAEGGRWEHPERRVWVFVHEIPDGTWGAGGNPLHLDNIIDFVAPGMGAAAVERFNGTKQLKAQELLAQAHASSRNG